MKDISITKSTDNVYAVLVHLLHLLNVDATDEGMAQIKEHVDYPSLSSLSEILTEFNVENAAVQIEASQLDELPCPSVLHLRKEIDYFVILTEISSSTVCYIDPSLGRIRENRDIFMLNWTGVALLVASNDQSGEEDFEYKRANKIVSRYSEYLALSLCTGCFLWVLIFIPHQLLFYYLLTTLGVVFCTLLMQKQFGNTNDAINIFCKSGGNSNCDSVLLSKASKIFGVIPLSEIGMIYFVGCFLTIMINVLGESSVLPGPLIVLCWVSFLFSFFSIYYQWRVVKAWCPLCLILMLIIWIETVSIFFQPVDLSFSNMAIGSSLIGFSLPFVFWFSLRQRFVKSFRVEGLEKALRKFSKSERIFEFLLSSQPVMDGKKISYEFAAGSHDAPVVLTLVSSPTCVPCSFTHSIVDNLLTNFEGKLKVNFRFMINTKDLNTAAHRMIKHVIALSMVDSESAREELSNWFRTLRSKSALDELERKYNVESVIRNEIEIDSILREHANWINDSKIESTPTVYINSKKFPEEFFLSDLKFHLTKVIESESVHQ